MNPDKQRIAIAEACGWTEIRMSGPWECSDPGQLREDLCGINPNHPCFRDLLPDYLNDLNAMHRAEEALDDKKYHAFTIELSRIGWKRFPEQVSDPAYKNRLRASFSATAAQRAEAFLKTLNLWEEEVE